MSTHNICFYGEIEKIIPELSSNTPPYQVPCDVYCLLITLLGISRLQYDEAGMAKTVLGPVVQS